MIKTYYLCQLGYEMPPAFPTLKSAREALREAVNDSLETAVRRGHKSARKHKLSKDSYRITLGRDLDSTIYSQFSIQ